MTTRLTLKQVGGSTKGRRETCRQLRQGRGPTCRQLRHRRQRGTKPIGRRAIGILSILQALTIGDFFLRVRTGIGCLEKNLQPTDVVYEQYTHKYSTYRVAQHDHIASREHAFRGSRNVLHQCSEPSHRRFWETPTVKCTTPAVIVTRGAAGLDGWEAKELHHFVENAL